MILNLEGLFVTCGWALLTVRTAGKIAAHSDHQGPAADDVSHHL